MLVKWVADFPAKVDGQDLVIRKELIRNLMTNNPITQCLAVEQVDKIQKNNNNLIP